MSNQNSPILCFSTDVPSQAGLLQVVHPFAEMMQSPLALLSLPGVETDELAQLGGYGADVVYRLEASQLEQGSCASYIGALVLAVKKLEPKLVLVAGNLQGLEIAAQAAQRLNAACINDVMAVEFAGDDLQLTGMIFSGRAQAKFDITRFPVFGTVLPTSELSEAVSADLAEVEDLPIELDPPQVRVVDVRPKEVLDRGIERAEKIVDFGQGVASREDISLIEQLAEKLGAQVVCSRPISSELGWMPDFIGLSGKRISPKLSICVGVSGAIQHMIGLRDSKIIVAINSDPEAGIFQQSDYGLVGDLYEIIPALIEVLE